MTGNVNIRELFLPNDPHAGKYFNSDQIPINLIDKVARSKISNHAIHCPEIQTFFSCINDKRLITPSTLVRLQTSFDQLIIE